jgi:hypothetical protein
MNESSWDEIAIDKRITLLEESRFAVLETAAGAEKLAAFKTESDNELQKFRAQMTDSQFEEVKRKLIFKRLLQAYQLPHLSPFYMA